MKKIAALLTVLMLFSFVFTACSGAPAGEETTAEETTLVPANSETETGTQDVSATVQNAENTAENTEESIFYVG